MLPNISMRYTRFGQVLRGLELVSDPQQMANEIEEHLAWMAVAGEANLDMSGGPGVWVDHLFRAYPDLEYDDEHGMLAGGEDLRDLNPADLKAVLTTVIQPTLEKTIAAIGERPLREMVRENDSLLSLVGQVNEKILGHPLRCCVFKPNVKLADASGRGDIWDSVVKLTGPDYKTYNDRLQRPGGTLHYLQRVCYEHATDKLSVGWEIIHESTPNNYALITQRMFPTSKRKPPPDAEYRAFIKATVDEAYALQLRRRYNWEVEFALSKERTGVVVTTDAEGARAMLATRTKAPRTRRGALMHWVREHWRRGCKTAPKDDVDLTFVRSHLRGKIDCEYGGLHCRIYPSQFDLDRACNGPKVAARLDALTIK